MRHPVVGMIGAGQLARMTQQAAIAIDVELKVLAQDAEDSAALVTPGSVVGSTGVYEDLERFAAQCDVVTFDHELIAPDLLRQLTAAGHRLHPAPHANLLAQDKAEQRRRLAGAGFPVPEHADAPDGASVEAFAEHHGWPVILKAARGGYDGRGVWVARDASEARTVIAGAQRAGTRLLVEERVVIEREVAVLVARDTHGRTSAYPLIETVQRQGILHELIVPARVPSAVAADAVDLALGIATEIDATGILAVELFVSQAGISVNELALRPHNSGHWTIEGATTSQFENHLRAVLGWPLGPTTLVAPAAVTVNILGPENGTDPRANLPGLAPVDGVRVHLYGKQARPGRKLGHVTALGADADDALRRAAKVHEQLVDGEEDVA